MFEKLSPAAIRVIMLAQEEARQMGTARVGTEHLLIGLMRDSQGIAGLALADQGLDLATLRTAAAIEVANHRVEGQIHYSAHTKMAVEMAEVEATRLGDAQVESEHLLIGLLALGDAVGAKLLEAGGLPLARLRWQALRLRRAQSGKALATPLLDQYTRDLTLRAVERTSWLTNASEPTVLRAIELFGTRRRTVPLLMGAPGKGMDRIVSGIIDLILAGHVFDELAHYRILALDILALKAETDSVTMFRQTVRQVLTEAVKADDVILVIEGVHTLLLAPPDTKEAVAAEQLLPLWQDGAIHCLVTAEREAAKTLLATDPFRYYLTGILVPDTDAAETLSILSGMRPSTEEFHQLQIPLASLEAAVRWAPLAMPELGMPEAALRLLDRAASHRRLRCLRNQLGLRDMERQLRQMKQERDRLTAEGQLDRLATLRQEAKAIEQAIARYSVDLLGPGERAVLTADDIAAYAQQEMEDHVVG